MRLSRQTDQLGRGFARCPKDLCLRNSLQYEYLLSTLLVYLILLYISQIGTAKKGKEKKNGGEPLTSLVKSKVYLSKV